MKILNVGALEILFIILLALIVLGPKSTVKALSDLGTWLKKIKESQIWQDLLNTSREIQELPKKMMDETELKKTLAEIEGATRVEDASINRTASVSQEEQLDSEAEENHQIYSEPTNKS